MMSTLLEVSIARLSLKRKAIESTETLMGCAVESNTLEFILTFCFVFPVNRLFRDFADFIMCSSMLLLGT